MALIKYAPFAGFESFPGLKAFEDTMGRLFAEPSGRPWVPPVDIKETENELIFKADVPDVKFEDIDVRLENGALTLSKPWADGRGVSRSWSSYPQQTIFPSE